MTIFPRILVQLICIEIKKVQAEVKVHLKEFWSSKFGVFVELVWQIQFLKRSWNNFAWQFVNKA